MSLGRHHWAAITGERLRLVTVLWIVPELRPIRSSRNVLGIGRCGKRMRTVARIILLASVTITAPGCTTVNTVPAWVGIPAQLVAPSSLEAMAWREGAPAMRAERHAERLER